MIQDVKTHFTIIYTELHLSFYCTVNLSASYVLSLVLTTLHNFLSSAKLCHLTSLLQVISEYIERYRSQDRHRMEFH